MEIKIATGCRNLHVGNWWIASINLLTMNYKDHLHQLCSPRECQNYGHNSLSLCNMPVLLMLLPSIGHRTSDILCLDKPWGKQQESPSKCLKNGHKNWRLYVKESTSRTQAKPPPPLFFCTTVPRLLLPWAWNWICTWVLAISWTFCWRYPASANPPTPGFALLPLCRVNEVRYELHPSMQHPWGLF